MNCHQCGAQVPENSLFCQECGTKVEEEPSKSIVKDYTSPYVDSERIEKTAERRIEKKDEKLEFLPVGGYMKILLAALFPIFNLPFLIMWSFSPKFKNRHNISRALLVLQLIFLMILVLAVFLWIKFKGPIVIGS